MTRFRVWLLASVLFAVGLAGCDSHGGAGVTAPSQPSASSSRPIERTGEILPQSGGCGDAFFWAANAAGTLAVTVTVDVHQRSAAVLTSIEFAVPDPKVKIEIQRGRGLVQPFCNDLITQEWHIDSRYPAVEGAGRVSVDPLRRPARCGSNGRLHLDGLVTGDGTRFAAIDVRTANIGCYAG